jgi:hypothetical protein
MSVATRMIPLMQSCYSAWRMPLVRHESNNADG